MPAHGMTEQELQNEIEKENKQLSKFIKNNPYPSYDFIVNDLIQKNKEFDQFAEYGTPNHQWIKEIYENILNDEIIKDNGKAIFERGSLYTLQYNYETLMEVLYHLIRPNQNMTDELRIMIYTNFKFIVSKRWEGIGGWRH